MYFLVYLTDGSVLDCMYTVQLFSNQRMWGMVFLSTICVDIAMIFFSQEKHWIIRMPPNPLPPDIISRVDEYWRRRWRTLLSVDDMVASIIQNLKQVRLLKNTFILVTSDNGYHLGKIVTSCCLNLLQSMNPNNLTNCFAQVIMVCLGTSDNHMTLILEYRCL